MQYHSLFDNLDAELNHFNQLYDSNSVIADEYFSIDGYKQKFIDTDNINNNQCISLLHWNVRSLLPKSDQIALELESMAGGFDLLCFCETWLTNFTKDLAGFNGYKAYHSFRDSCSPGGGVSIFAKSNLKTNINNNFSISLPFFESVAIEITKNNRKFFICEIYRPPRSNPIEFLGKLEALFNNFNTSHYDEIFICGDFNLNLLDSESNNPTNQFVNQMASNSLLPVISRPTRITEQTASLIDNIFINHPNNFTSGIVISTISDHLPIFIRKIISSNTNELNEPKIIQFRPISDGKISLLRDALSAVNFDEFTNQTDIDAAWLAFTNKIFQLYDREFPIQTKTLSPKSDIKPWINAQIVSKIKKRNLFYVKYLQGRATRAEFNAIRNNINYDIRRAKKNYYKNEFEKFKSDMFKTWSTINKALNPQSSRSVITKMRVDGNIVENKDSIANGFNEYFSTIGSNIANSIDNQFHDHREYLTGSYTDSMFFGPTTPQQIYSIIHKLKNKKCNIFNIPVRLLKSISDILSPVLCKLINKSILLGTFPNCLKIANVIPIPKEGDKLEMCNY